MAIPNSDLKRIVTGRVRLSYEHLFRPYKDPRNTDPNSKPKYGCTVILPKSDTVTMQKMQVAIQAAIEEGIPKKWGGYRPPNIPLPIYDGDGARPSDGKPYGPECKGCWVFTASSEQQPEIVDKFGNKIINPSEIYSGIYAFVSVQFGAYNNRQKGIGAYLGNVMKIDEGEPLGSGPKTAADDFGIATNGGFSPNGGGYNSPAPSPISATQFPGQGYPGGAVPGMPFAGQPAPTQPPQFNQGFPGAAMPNATIPGTVMPGQPVNFQPMQPAQPFGQQQINPVTGQPYQPGQQIFGIGQ